MALIINEQVDLLHSLSMMPNFCTCTVIDYNNKLIVWLIRQGHQLVSINYIIMNHIDPK